MLLSDLLIICSRLRTNNRIVIDTFDDGADLSSYYRSPPSYVKWENAKNKEVLGSQVYGELSLIDGLVAYIFCSTQDYFRP